MTEQGFDIFASSVRDKLLAIAWHSKAGYGLDDEPEDIVQEALLTLWRLISNGYPVRDADAEDRRTIRDNLFKSLTPTQRHYLELIICRTCCANSDSEVHQLVVT